jgi:hypothetical protein
VDEREIRPGDYMVDMDGHLWRVVRVAADTVVLRGRGATIEFPLADGVIVSDREFCPATLPGGHCLHGFPGGAAARSATPTARRPSATRKPTGRRTSSLADGERTARNA